MDEEKKVGAPPMKWPQLKAIEIGLENGFFVALNRAQAARQAAFNYGQRHSMAFRSKRYGSQIKIWRVA